MCIACNVCDTGNVVCELVRVKKWGGGGCWRTEAGLGVTVNPQEQQKNTDWLIVCRGRALDVPDIFSNVCL